MTEYCGLPLTIKDHPRAKRVLVKLVPGRGLEVVTPKRFNKKRVPAILDEKRRWIERTRDQLLANGVNLNGAEKELPDSIEYRASGQGYQVHYLNRSGRISVTANGPRLMVSGPKDDIEGILESLEKFTAKQAREFVLPRLESMSRKLGMEYSALRIRRQKTRWGSCSGKGTISLNAKLLFLPLELVDHLLLHELCHTKHMNHSKLYWSLVALHQPDFARLEKELAHGRRFVPPWFG